jgi:glycerol dehydrogenase
MTNKTMIFGSPGRYVQGAGAIYELGEHLTPLGSSILVAGGRTGLSATREGREISFGRCGLRQTEVLFGGESSDAEIARLVSLGRASGCDVILASGGGKVIDAVKAAAEDLGIPAAVVPTVASNDAPCSALAIVYNPDGSFARLRPLYKSPALVLVDTQIIADAPVRQLVAGMGDALATWFEADACSKSGALNNFGGHISPTAMALGRLCLDTLLEYGTDAKRACEAHTVTPALERVVEANTLLSGLGFASGGVAVAHALSEGFSVIGQMHDYSHGEKVAFGLLVHLILENRPQAVVDEIVRFCLNVGLPVTLSDLGCVDVGESPLRLAAEEAAGPGKPSHNLPFPVTADGIYEAILEADALGRKLKTEH